MNEWRDEESVEGLDLTSGMRPLDLTSGRVLVARRSGRSLFWNGTTWGARGAALVFSTAGDAQDARPEAEGYLPVNWRRVFVLAASE